ncbi:hypothetical protein RH858_08120 [Halalkaliarchaeum sp. AArc-GB]|uniref:homing endonuclease associated repeat-containing protein n=1 Tax=Halalkaliarchaeum sp. AArc-GB TaxID=3074078 RepID=UPI002858D458|nr:hypothetical protein [Halalkaliarchaeum sp. AArc-GB]MDR5673114.1 hypothetical protein [Halalkaliarchaeum sp. AArc-GB]
MTASPDELRSDLQSLATELGRAPTPDEIDEKGSYSMQAYREQFGSWGNALAEADLKKPMGHRIPDQELLAELRRLADELDRTPKEKDMTSRGHHGTQTYRNRFGSWNQAVEAAGLSPRPDRREPSREELIAELQRVADELGRSPTWSEMKDHGEFVPNTYRSHFGSWNDALEAAELEPRKAPEEIPRDELLEELRRLVDKHGTSPKTTDMERDGAFSPGTYHRRFGSWNDALEAAELDPRESLERVSREELLNELRRLADERGSAPRTTDMVQDGAFNPGTYRRRFGSWDGALEAAGLDPRESSGQISRDELLSELHRIADEKGAVPKTTDMIEEGAFSPGTYNRRFGSWDDALSAAGLAPE